MAPPKAAFDSNHLFLYEIIKHTDGNVDCKALAKSTNSTEMAARMRILRLKRALDSHINENAKVDAKAANSADETQSDHESPVAKKRRVVKRKRAFPKTESHADELASEKVDDN